MVAAFEKSKAALADAALLSHPEEKAEISVAVDASDHHVGAVLQQLVAGRGWRPWPFSARSCQLLRAATLLLTGSCWLR